jgi:hypothetical protein
LFRAFDQSRLDRISLNVRKMDFKVIEVANPVVGKSRNPNIPNPLEFPFGSKRESAFQALNRQIKTGAGRNQQMEMIGHQNKSMKQVTFWAVPVKRFKK